MTLILSGTDGLSDVDGSAATPAIRGTDANTGIFFPAADTIAFSEGGVESMRIDSSGNVGINTSSPTQKLDVNGNIRTTGAIATSAADFVYSWAGGTTGQIRSGFYLDGSNQVLRFYTAQADVGRFDSSGNLLVGVTSGSYHRFDKNLNGDWCLNARNSGNSTPYGFYVQYPNASPNGSSNEFIYCADSTALRASIRSNGGIANYSANNVNLASDLRLKHDIEPVQSYWNVFKSIEWKTWIYNDQTDEIKNIGVIAQELQALAPELVCESNALPTPEGESPYLGLWENDFKMAGMSVITELVKRCEEQQALITTLTDRITALETPTGTQA